MTLKHKCGINLNEEIPTKCKICGAQLNPFLQTLWNKQKEESEGGYLLAHINQ